MIRISASDLESLRYWLDDEDAEMHALLARLKHEEPPTEQMMAGRALAKLCENAAAGHPIEAETVDGWRFDFTAINATIALPPLRELKGEMLFDTPHGKVTLVGKVDGLAGRQVRDQKLTERWDAERYLDSLQWRVYLVMFNATSFVYDVFLRNKHQEGERDVEIREYHPMTFYPYPGIRADVDRAVAELARVITVYFPELVRPDDERAAS